MNAKKTVLLISVAYTIFFVTIFLASELCHSSWCRIHDDDPLGLVFFIFLPLLPTLLLSLITYRMRDEVFRAWWRFARWWVPVIIAATLFLENASGGGTLGMDKDFTIFILSILYTVLIITSLVKIVRAHSKTRNP
jgi:hypothetical protein